MTRIIILGGGYGGVLTAKKLIRKLKKKKDVTLALIDRNPYHTLLTELHEVAAGRVDESCIKLEFEKIFAGRKIEIIKDEIISIDFNDNKLHSKENTYDYDYLVIAAGSRPAFYGIKGAEEFALRLWSYEDAVRIREHILSMFRKAAVAADSKLRAEMLSFAVVGAGFTGVEIVAEIAEWAGELCEKFNIGRDEINITVVDLLPSILPHVPEKLRKRAVKILKKMNVKLLTDSHIIEVKENSICMKDSCILDTRTVIWASGVEGSELVGKLPLQKKERNRIVADANLRSVDHQNVYVTGDNLYYIPSGCTEPVPQMVENCEHAAPVIAHNIICAIYGGAMKEYEPTFHGVMVSLGGRHAIAHLGIGKRKFCLYTFFAMFLKHFVNVLYFFQIAGWHKSYSYVMHEIFHVRNGRSFLGAHFSKASPNFWKVPLRMFLGFMWLREGIRKAPDVLKDFNKIFLFNMPSADSVSSATGSGSEWGTALPVPGFIEDVVNWMLGNIIGPVAPYFQALIVLAEIVLGLMLLGGLFSAFASVAAAALCVMIYFSGMAPEEIIWYFVAAIACIGGSGSTFGLDYYVLPYLKKKWRRIGLVKKWYLYNE